MIGMAVRSLTKRYAGSSANAVDNIDLAVEEGELIVLLGPSGCGKTTTLRCIAGLETPDSGAIDIGSDKVFDHASRRNTAAAKRNIGMVFQTYALWPHKTVRGNIAFPLKARKIREGLSSGWVEQAAALVECESLLERYPSQLSGGQQQRVALARGLVARPRLMLFDEPLSNLDARLREQVRSEVHELHQRLRFTGVYVTHDQSEALAIADRIAVMRDGRIDQIGGPQEVFDRPNCTSVASFVGFVNEIAIQREESSWRSPLGILEGLQPHFDSDDESVTIRARTEDVQTVAAGCTVAGSTMIRGAKVVDCTFGGRAFNVVVSIDDKRLSCTVPTAEFNRTPLLPGAVVDVAIAVDRCRTFGDSGAALDAAWTTEAALVDHR